MQSGSGKKEQLFPRITTPDFRPSTSLSPTPSARQGRRLSEDFSASQTLTPTFAYKRHPSKDREELYNSNGSNNSSGILYHSKSQQNAAIVDSSAQMYTYSSGNLYNATVTRPPTSSGPTSPMPSLNLKRISSPTLQIPSYMPAGPLSAPPSSHISYPQSPMIISSVMPTAPPSPTPYSLATTWPSDPESISITVPSPPISTTPSTADLSISVPYATLQPSVSTPPSSTNLSISTPVSPMGRKERKNAFADKRPASSTAAISMMSLNGGNAGNTLASSAPLPKPASPNMLPVPQPNAARHAQHSTADQPIQKAISAFREIQNYANNKFDYRELQAQMLVVGSAKNSLVGALRELKFAITVISSIKDAIKHLRDGDSVEASSPDTQISRKYDVIIILCDFQSLRDTLPVSALNSMKAVAPTLPIVMAINSFHDSQILRLMKEGAQDVIHPPYAQNILLARLSPLLENTSLKRRFTQLAQENANSLTEFVEKLQHNEKRAKMRDLQVKILEEVRTNAEVYVKKLEDKVTELESKAEANTQKMKAANVALKWKMIARQGSSAALLQQGNSVREALATPYQKLMAMARQLDRDINNEEVEFLLYDLSRSGYISSDVLDELHVNLEVPIEICELSRIDFCPLDLSEDRLISMVCKMFTHLNLLSDFNIPEKKFARFLRTLSTNYKENPYHNWYHACDVMQMVFFVLVTTDLSTYLSKLDILSLLLAALCHDVEHPGLNNAFQINSKATLALIYNDVSVLENHHCSHTFALLRESDENILDGLTDAQFKEVRFSMINSILNTDMARHFELLTRFNTVVQKPGFSPSSSVMPLSPTSLSASLNRSPSNPTVSLTASTSSSTPLSTSSLQSSTSLSSATSTLSPPPANPLNRSSSHISLSPSTSSSSLRGQGKTQLDKPDRQVLLETILHTADISNIVRPWNIAKVWSDKLVEEFLIQGDSERELGLPVSPYMDRKDADQVKMSLNFIDFLCQPLYSAVVKAFPTLNVCLENLQKNRECWEQAKTNV